MEHPQDRVDGREEGKMTRNVKIALLVVGVVLLALVVLVLLNMGVDVNSTTQHGPVT
jgi:hypothetical protein